ncbi:MAG: O-antigen ligase family protein [Leptospiraceae bacterium]|nr:O-antigen ligase family protein [Leptospiraceae bacterium]
MQTGSIASHWTMRLSAFGGALMIVAFPLSVSLSQAGLGLALIGWILARIWNRTACQQRLPLRMHPFFWSALAVYLILFATLLVNALLAEERIAFLARGLRAEVKDIILLPAGFWVMAWSSKPEGRKQILRWLEWSVWLLLLTGFLAIWSRYRISKIPWLLLHDWQVGPSVRFQHHLATIPLGSFPLNVYMPIGMMNTHLTYAGLLMFAWPWLLLRTLHPWIRQDWREYWLGPQRYAHYWHWFGLVLASLLFILNNGRSALLGALLSGVVGVLYFIKVHWGRSALKLLLPAILSVILLTAFGSLAPLIHPRMARAVNALFSAEKKHTDHQRTLVWNGSLELSRQSPLIGVGSGHFEDRLKEHIITYSSQHPHLWPWYNLAQRGHAHNDYLHLLAIGGLFALAAYLILAGVLFQSSLIKLPLELETWKFGPLALLVAGFLQCYFLDDEVILPFWIYVGLCCGAAITESARPQKSAPGEQ